MKIRLRLLEPLLKEMHHDLSRPHTFAFERVGFLTCQIADLPSAELLLLGVAWHPVDDTEYVDNPRVGACIGPAAFRRILQHAYGRPVSILHAHRHEHLGPPAFSRTDLSSMHEFVPGFFNACRTRPHGALVLSHDSVAGAIWPRSNTTPASLDRFEVTGRRLTQRRHP